jgi:hypothetical protein
LLPTISFILFCSVTKAYESIDWEKVFMSSWIMEEPLNPTRIAALT